MGFNGGFGMNVERMCGGINMMAGPELAPRVICPAGVDFLILFVGSSAIALFLYELYYANCFL
jgi:hypothetical protein